MRRLSARMLSNAECDLLSASYRRPGRAAGLDGRRRGAAGRAGAPAGPAARAGGAPRSRCSSTPTPRSPRWSPRPTGWPRRGRSTRSSHATTTYAHILVDEAQDITPMQWRMLRRRGPSASWTIVGDPAQSSWPDAAEAERAITEMIGTAPVRRFRMSTNYRSPAEVFDLAAKVVSAGLPAGRPAPGGPLHRRASPSWPVAGRTASAASHDRPSYAGLLERGRGHGRGDLSRRPGWSALTERLAAAELPRSDRVRRGQPAGVEGSGVRRRAGGRPRPDRGRRRPAASRSLYVALTRPTQRLVTLDAAPGAGWRRSLGSPGNGSG